MQIIIVTQDYPSDKEPTRGIFVHQQAKALKQIGHMVKVLHYIRRKPFWRKQIIHYEKQNIVDGIQVRRILYYWPSKKILDFGWCRAIAIALKKEFKDILIKNDTIIYAQWLLPTTAACLLITRDYKLPVVGIARGYDLGLLPYRSIYMKRKLDFVWRKANHIITNGEWGERSLKKLGYDLSNRKIEIVRNVRQLNTFLKNKPRKRNNEPLKVITIAALESHKGIDILLKACAKLKCIDFELEIIGDGSERNMLKAMARELQLEKQVTFLGRILFKEISSSLKKAHVFVLPSRREGASNALIEAMASALGCIATQLGGSQDLIKNSESGLLIPKENSKALSEAILYLFKNEKKRQFFGKEARKKVNTLYSYKRNLKILERSLLSVLGNST